MKAAIYARCSFVKRVAIHCLQVATTFRSGEHGEGSRNVADVTEGSRDRDLVIFSDESQRARIVGVDDEVDEPKGVRDLRCRGEHDVDRGGSRHGFPSAACIFWNAAMIDPMMID